MNDPAPSSRVADLLSARLIVSCQAPPGDPLRDTGTLVRLARAAAAGGAAGIRANEPEVIAAISAAVDLPLIGLWKDGDTGVYITPTVRHALAVAEAGAHVVAADATARPRPDGGTFADIVAAVHAAGALVMADVATFDEGVAAAAAGADFVSTTLSGYVPGSPARTVPISIWCARSPPRWRSPSSPKAVSAPPRRPRWRSRGVRTASSSAPRSPRPPR